LSELDDLDEFNITSVKYVQGLREESETRPRARDCSSPDIWGYFWGYIMNFNGLKELHESKAA